MIISNQLMAVIFLLVIALVLSVLDLIRYRRKAKREAEANELNRKAINAIAQKYGKKPAEVEASIRRSGIVKQQKRDKRVFAMQSGEANDKH